MWYIGDMSIDLGAGPTLRDALPWLREARGVESILDAAERNSVIEGLPPFTGELRAELRREVQAILAAPSAAPRE